MKTHAISQQPDACPQCGCTHASAYDLGRKDEALRLEPTINELHAAKDAAYSERDRLVAALSKCFPSFLGRHPENEVWEDDWRNIVFVMLPTGQASWHIHDSELPLFGHLIITENIQWDGHDTATKYERLACLPVSPGSRVPL